MVGAACPRSGASSRRRAAARSSASASGEAAPTGDQPRGRSETTARAIESVFMLRSLARVARQATHRPGLRGRSPTESEESGADRMRRERRARDIGAPSCAYAGMRTQASGRPPRPQRLGDGAVVEPVELAADRHAAGQHGHRHARRRQPVGEVVGGGLAVDGGGQGQDHLAHARRSRPGRPARRRAGRRGRRRPAPTAGRPARGSGPGRRRPAPWPTGRRPPRPRRSGRRRGAGRRRWRRGRGCPARRRSSRAAPCAPASARACGQGVEQLLAPLEQGQRRAPGRARAQPRQLGQQRDQPLDLGSGGGGQALELARACRACRGHAGQRARGLAHQLGLWPRPACAWRRRGRRRSGRRPPRPRRGPAGWRRCRRRAARRCRSGSTLTMPPPAVPSTVVSASLAWASCSFCCIAWACFISALRSFMAFRSFC